MFLTPLDLQADPQPDYWLVGRPLVWCDPVYGRIEAPAGFRTDLASIPRLFRNLPAFDPNGASRRPAVIHDWLYSSRVGYRYGRDFADSFLRTALLAEGAGIWAARAFYWAVRVGGASHWDPLSSRPA
jgi:hypothetical protein